MPGVVLAGLEGHITVLAAVLRKEMKEGRSREDEGGGGGLEGGIEGAERTRRKRG